MPDWELSREADEEGAMVREDSLTCRTEIKGHDSHFPTSWVTAALSYSSRQT